MFDGHQSFEIAHSLFAMIIRRTAAALTMLVSISAAQTQGPYAG